MTAIIARPAAGATTAPKRSKAKPQPSRRGAAPAEPEPLTAHDFRERMRDIGVHWWSLIDHVFNVQRSAKGQAEPLPQWAIDILEDQGRHDSSHDEHRVMDESLRELARLADGRSTYCFEVWGNRTTRLSLRHESIADAMPARDHWRANGYPDACIVKLHRSSNCTTASGIAMLETMVGRVWFAGVTLASGSNDEDVFQLQDETGRTVELHGDELRGHPIIERIQGKNRESLLAWLADKPTKKMSRKGGLQ